MLIQFINKDNNLEKGRNKQVSDEVANELERELPYENIKVYSNYINLFADDFYDLGSLISLVERLIKKVNNADKPFSKEERKLIREKLGL